MPHTSVATDAGVGYSCRELTVYPEFREAAALYARVFDYSGDEYALNSNLLRALTRNGGSAVGAFTPDERLIGFAYGFAGCDGNEVNYHYSQAAAVDSAHQGKGVGQALKLAQREVALRCGQRTMRWTFDPLLARNAHFNLSSLGAVGIAFERDYYARPDTDRLVVSWDLVAPGGHRSDPVSAPTVGRADWGREVRDDVGGWIVIPAQSGALTPAERVDVRSRLAQTLTVAFTRGDILVASSRIDADTAVYRAIPGEDTP